MSYKEYKPCDELKKFIKCFWIMEREYSEDSFLGDTEYLWPTGLTEILYVKGSKFRYVEDSKEEILSEEFVIGAYNKRFALKNNGKVRVVGIRCYNHGANILFGIDLNNIKNSIEEYKLDGLDKEILDSEDKDCIIGYLNEYCKKYINENSFTEIIYRLYENGDISLDELCKEQCLSLRQFERKVKSITGFNPKELATIIRFDKARINMLLSKDYMQVMSDLGYYDYSHFSKEFKKYYSITPKQFIDIYNRF